MAAGQLVNCYLTRRWHNSAALLPRLVQQLDNAPVELEEAGVQRATGQPFFPRVCFSSPHTCWVLIARPPPIKAVIYRGAATVSVYDFTGWHLTQSSWSRFVKILDPRMVRVRKRVCSAGPRTVRVGKKSCGSGSADNRVRSPHTSGLWYE